MSTISHAHSCLSNYMRLVWLKHVKKKKRQFTWVIKLEFLKILKAFGFSASWAENAKRQKRYLFRVVRGQVCFDFFGQIQQICVIWWNLHAKVSENTNQNQRMDRPGYKNLAFFVFSLFFLKFWKNWTSILRFLQYWFSILVLQLSPMNLF